jgi:colicin import membrane protein
LKKTTPTRGAAATKASEAEEAAEAKKSTEEAAEAEAAKAAKAAKAKELAEAEAAKAAKTKAKEATEATKAKAAAAKAKAKEATEAEASKTATAAEQERLAAKGAKAPGGSVATTTRPAPHKERWSKLAAYPALAKGPSPSELGVAGSAQKSASTDAVVHADAQSSRRSSRGEELSNGVWRLPSPRGLIHSVGAGRVSS